MSYQCYAPPARTEERFQIGHDLLYPKGSSGVDDNVDDLMFDSGDQRPLAVFAPSQGRDLMGPIMRRPKRVKGLVVDIASRDECSPSSCFAPDSACNVCGKKADVTDFDPDEPDD